MLVIDESKLKLLRMKEKLLEFPIDNQDKVLSEYKEMVIEIDKTMYERLINMVKDTNYHSLPLEEQLRFLTKLESEYNSFNEFQCRYREIYERYASHKLELSSIDNIYIDRIRSKISAINGYLMNNEKILSYHNTLEKLNVQLIDTEKKKDAIGKRLQLLESELKENVLNSLGKIDNNGNVESTNILKEFSNQGLDLVQLFDDKDFLEQEIKKTGSLLAIEEEKMGASKVCFNSMPNIETKRLYNSVYMDVLKTNYRLTLLKFAKFVGDEFTTYERIRDKRVKLVKLISERAKILIDLGIKYVVDPFDEIKVNDQLEIVDLLGINLQSIASVKEKIKDTFETVDSLKAKNNELYLVISENLKLCNDDTSIGNVIDSYDVKVEHVVVDPKKVMQVKKLPLGFKLAMVKEKTDGVINKVNKMVGNPSTVLQEQSVAPELVIEKESIFADNNLSEDIFKDDGKHDDSAGVDNSLFEEIEPFEQIGLFTDKYEDVFSIPQVVMPEIKDEKMPDLLFADDQKIFDDKKEEAPDGSELSLDEQIKALKLVP